MSRRDIQRAVMRSEQYWFGGPLGAPKVYDTGTNFNAPPTLRGGETASPGGASAGPTGRTMRYTSTDDGWEVVFDED